MTSKVDETELEISRPEHVFDALNAQGQQEKEDDLDEGMEDDPDSMLFHWYGKAEAETYRDTKMESVRYKKIQHKTEEELISLTRQLAPEQKEALTHVLNFCKDQRQT